MSVTIVIIILTVLTSIRGLNNPDVYHKWMMNPYLVFHRQQVWRLISSGFIHGSLIHLGFNMFTFFFFGRIVEQIFGELHGEFGLVIYVLFYISAIIVASLPGGWKKRNLVNYNSLGASGAVSAVVFASILYFPLNDICLYGFVCIPGFILGTVYVIYSYFQGKNLGGDNIDHEAHLYGALYGIVFALIIYPPAASNFISQISSYRIPFFN